MLRYYLSISERILEDHDSLVENMVMWTRDSKNKVLFEERSEKFDLFKHPEVSIFGCSDSSLAKNTLSIMGKLIVYLHTPS